MANPILPIPAYPNVPNSPGVPNVLRGNNNDTPDTGPVLTSDDKNVTDTSIDPQWGLFNQDGTPAVTATSVFAFEYKKPYTIPTYPQEQGAFQSYNKVQLPGEPRLIFTQAGSIADRTAFLKQVQAAVDSLNLFIVYTPEMQFPSVNAIEYNIMNRTSENGATVIKVEMMLEEVRVSASQSFTSSSTNASPTNTAQPSGQANKSTGPVQTTPLTPSQTAATRSSLALQTLQVA